jgi:hypothetical protein
MVEISFINSRIREVPFFGGSREVPDMVEHNPTHQFPSCTKFIH